VAHHLPPELLTSETAPMTIRWLLLALVLLPVAAQAGGVEAVQADVFKRYLVGMRGRPNRDYRNGMYPTEAAIFFLAGWMLTDDRECLDAARHQIGISRSWVTPEGIFDGSKSGEYPQITRDSFARHVYNCYTAYRVLGEAELLAHVDHCAEGWMKYLRREPLEWQGRHFRLFDVVFGTKPPHVPASGTGIDVNQNAEIGLVFTLLYHDPASRWHHNARVRDIAFEELRAGMAAQNMDTGAIPIGGSPEWIDKYDTNYGAYALFSWTWANRLWQDAEMARHIRKAVDWLDPTFDGETRAVHWYPRHFEEPQYAAACGWTFAAFAAENRDLSRLLRIYEADLTKATGQGWPSWLACQPYLWAMGLPADQLRLVGLPDKWATSAPRPGGG
jgi:hypothetical protein